jgi:hypothetical protein
MISHCPHCGVLVYPHTPWRIGIETCEGCKDWKPVHKPIGEYSERRFEVTPQYYIAGENS